jgi:hypothetical protein
MHLTYIFIVKFLSSTFSYALEYTFEYQFTSETIVHVILNTKWFNCFEVRRICLIIMIQLTRVSEYRLGHRRIIIFPLYFLYYSMPNLFISLIMIKKVLEIIQWHDAAWFCAYSKNMCLILLGCSYYTYRLPKRRCFVQMCCHSGRRWWCLSLISCLPLLSGAKLPLGQGDFW